MSHAVEPNDRPIVSKRPSSRPVNESTSSNDPPPVTVMLVRARLRTLWFFPSCQLPPTLIVCWPRVWVSEPETSKVSVGDVVIG